MAQLRTYVDNNGRILIPAQIRKAFNIKAGDIFVMRIIDGEIRMISLDKAIADAQKLIRKHVPEGISLVDELFKERKEDLARQEGRK
jgi:AbrB family looped-hinge helix DNA binding protein